MGFLAIEPSDVETVEMYRRRRIVSRGCQVLFAVAIVVVAIDATLFAGGALLGMGQALVAGQQVSGYQKASDIARMEWAGL